MLSPPSSSTKRTRDLFAWLNQVIADADLPDAAFKVAYIIGQHVNIAGEAWPSTERIAELCGLHQSTALRLARRLTDRGHLAVEPGKPGRGHSHHYRPILKHAPVHVSDPGKDAPAHVLKHANTSVKDAIGGSKTCASAYEPLRTIRTTEDASRPGPLNGPVAPRQESELPKGWMPQKFPQPWARPPPQPNIQIRTWQPGDVPKLSDEAARRLIRHEPAIAASS